MYFELHKSEKTVKELLKKEVMPITGACFYYYYQKYNGSENYGNIYFGFYADPKIKKLIAEINENFKNIKIVFFESPLVDFNGDYSRRLVFPGEDRNKQRFYIFRVELNERYSQKSNFEINMAIAQFIRAFCPEYSHYQYAQKIKQNYINNCLGVFKDDDYGSWSGSRTWTRDEFNLLDNIEFINKVTSYGTDFSDMPYVSKFYDRIKRHLK